MVRKTKTETKTHFFSSFSSAKLFLSFFLLSSSVYWPQEIFSRFYWLYSTPLDAEVHFSLHKLVSILILRFYLSFFLLC